MSTPLLFVVGEVEVHQALASQPDFDLHPECFDSFGRFMRALENREIPHDYAPSVVVFSDAAHEHGVAFDSFARTMQRVGVLISWGTRPVPSADGLIVLQPPLTPNALRHAVGDRLNHHYGPLPNGDHHMFVVGHQEPVAPIPPSPSSNGATPQRPGIPVGPLTNLDRQSDPGRPVAPPPRAPTPAGGTPAQPGRWPTFGPNSTQIPTQAGGPHHPAFTQRPTSGPPPTPPPTPQAPAPPARAPTETQPAVPTPSPRPAPATAPQTAPPAAAPPAAPATETYPAARAPVPSPQAVATRPRQVLTTTTIAVWSGKGGVGKTSIAINLAARLAYRSDLAVCLLDLDIAKGGNVSVALNRWSPTVLDLIRQPNLTPQALDIVYREPTTGFDALFAPVTPDEAADGTLLSPATYERILRVLRQRYDVIIIDCGTSVTDKLNHAFAFPQSDAVLVIVDNDKAAMFDVARGLDSMLRASAGGRGGLQAEQIAVVFNGMVDNVDITDDDIRKVVLQQRAYPVLARFAHDATLWRGSLNVRRFVSLIGSQDIQRGFDDILLALIPGLQLDQPDPQAQPDRRSRGLLQRLLGR